MEPLYGAVGLVLVALVSGFFTWRIAKQTKSGKIDTTEAAKLWDEGTEMRRELKEEVVSLRARLTEAINAISDLNSAIERARAETERAREETHKSREETQQLMAQIAAISGEVKTSNQLTIANLADNTETRRILGVPEDERSKMEQQHIDTAGDRLPEGSRPSVPSDTEGDVDG